MCCNNNHPKEKRKSRKSHYQCQDMQRLNSADLHARKPWWRCESIGEASQKKKKVTQRSTGLRFRREVFTHSVTRRGSAAAGLVSRASVRFRNAFRAQGLGRGLGPTAVENGKRHTYRIASNKSWSCEGNSTNTIE